MHTQEQPYSPFRAFLTKFMKQRLAVAASVVIIMIVLIGVFGRWLTPFDPGRPVNDQYEEKGLKPAFTNSLQLPVAGVLSDGTKLDASRIEGLAGGSERTEVARVQINEKGINIVAVSGGVTAVTITAGDIAAVVEVGVSDESRKPLLSQLTAKTAADKLVAGESTAIELEAVMTDGSTLQGADAIMKRLEGDLEGDDKKADGGFVLPDAEKADSGISFKSATPEIVEVSDSGIVQAVSEGQGRIVIGAGQLSTVLHIGVGAASESVVLSDLELEKRYIALSDLSKHQPPNALHWLGTDHANRDILSRLIAGTEQTLIIGFVSVLIGAVLGVLLGLLSGYYGGLLDGVVTRGSDILLSFPGMLLAIFVIAVLGPGTVNVILAVAVFTVPIFTRIVRSSVLSLKEMTYVEAARSIGVKDSVILARHIFPGTVSVITIYLTMRVGSAILIGAGLSFLGLGADVTAPEWGAMLNAAKNNSHGIWFPLLFPGLCILITVLCFNIMGDGLRDALDPKLKD